MKFKARLGQDGVTTVQSLLATLDRVCNTCVLHLSPQKITFAVVADNTDGNTNDMQVFAALNQAAVFQDYRIQSLNDNNISLELGCGNLLRAINSGRNTAQVQVKLAKRGGQATLCLEMKQLDIEVTHDVPVRVLRANEAHLYNPPRLPTPEVRLEMPKLRSIKAVIDRMRSIDKTLLVEADMQGNLSFKVTASMVSISSYYKNLVSRSEALSGEPVDDQHVCRVRVDVKSFAKMLGSQSMAIETAIFCVIEQYSLVLHLILAPAGAGSITYYLPVLAED